MRSLRKGTPGKGDALRPDSFSYTQVAHGTRNAFNAYVAGEPFWCEEAHEHKPPIFFGTQPCLYWITNGALDCPRCKKQPATKVVGWFPVWREQDQKPCIVILHQEAFDQVRDLNYGDPVLIGRVDEVSGVFVQKLSCVARFTTENPHRKHAQDITRSLLAMWRLPELDLWLKSAPAPEVEPQSHEHSPEEVEAAKKQFSSMNRAAALRWGAVKTDGPQLVGDVNAAFVEEVKRAEKNGQHKPKKGGN